MPEALCESPDAPACPICNSRCSEVALVAHDRVEMRSGSFRYRRCISCGLLSQDPLPSEAEIRAFYPDAYASHHPSGRALSDRQGRRLSKRFGAGRSLTRPRGGRRLLDVGCGAGDLLMRHEALGWQVFGVEVAARAVAAARERGLRVEHGTLQQASLPEAPFDLILLHHVLEHLADPVATLARAGELLAPGGSVLVTTPNLRSVAFSLYRSCWYSLDAPRHLHLFDATTLRAAASRAGLALVRATTRPGARQLAESRRYALTQGVSLPSDPETRAAILSESAASRTGSKTFRRAVRMPLWLFAKLGRGDELVARLERPIDSRREFEQSSWVTASVARAADSE